MFSLQALHSFRLPAHCQNLTELKQLGRPDISTPLFILGEGSNTLFVEDFAGTVLKVGLRGVQLSESNDAYLIKVAAGENWHEFVCWCMQQQIYGLENLALIPGTVGAAPIQNIGAYGVEVADFIQSVETLDVHSWQPERFSHQACNFAYRNSVFKSELANTHLIVNVNFCIPKKWQAQYQYGELADLVDPKPIDIFNQVIAIRQRKLPDPKRIGNAGSFFKNPIIAHADYQLLKQRWPELPGFTEVDNQVKVPAAWLIDKLGFKGQMRGEVGCHARQPLVLFNNGAATGSQVLAFAREIRAAVKQEFSISLENEVRLVGHEGVINL